jgi:hypothetical protein
MNLVMRLLKASRNHSLVGRTLLKKRSLIVSDGGSLGLGPETAGEAYIHGFRTERLPLGMKICGKSLQDSAK